MPELGIGLGITKGAAPKAKLLLDKYDIDAAFSLRKVRAEYNGPCVRVRNNAGTLKDIGFTSTGVLDEDALNAHCGSNDGTVQTWYNQSAEGGQYNAVQDTTADQPIIYDASAGGYLGYVENTGDMYLRFENQLTGVTDAGVVYENTTVPGAVSGSAYVVGEHEVSATGGNGILVGHNSANGFSFVPNSGITIETHTGEGQNEKHAGFVYVGGSDKFAVVDGYVCGESSNTGSANLDYIFTKAKNDGDQDSFDFVGKVWEVFLSTSDLSANRIALENSILSANELTVPEQTLLEKYDGAEGAFSTRCINREHVGPILRVRNEVDHALRVVVDQDNFGDTAGRLGITKTVPGVSNSDTPTCTFEIYADCPSVTGNVNISGQFGNDTRATTPTNVPQNQWVSVSINTLSTPTNSGLFRVYFAGITLQSLDSGDRIYFRNFDYDHPNGAGDTVSYDSDFSSNVDGFGKVNTEPEDFSLNGGLGSSPLRNIYLQSDGTLNTDYLETQCTLATDKFDGFVQTWFDQSSYGYDATNATTSQQPKIYDETDGVVLLDGKPAVEFDGSDDILESSSQTINTEAIIAVASTNNEATVAQHIIRQGTAYIRFDGSNKVEYRNNANLRDDTVNNCPGLVNDNAALVSWYTKGTSFNDANASWKWYFNGDLLGTETGDNLSSETGAIKIGAQTTTQELLNGKVCEAIIIDKRDAHYDSADQIHKDINAHYLIYQEVDTTTGFISNSAYNAKLAHSVRKLSGSLLCCQVERSSDSAKRNIGWGSDGFVDTAAIEEFCGSSSGKILTVYDQSGQGYHAYTDPAKTNFLWIYDGTDIYTSNGLPAFYNKDASTDASYVYSNSGSYSTSKQYFYDDQTKASYSVVCGPMTQNADTAANGQDYLITTADLTVYRSTSQKLRVDIFDSGEGMTPPISTANAASSQRVIMAGGTLGGTVWGHIDDFEDNDNVDNPEGWYGTVATHKIDLFFSASENQADNPYIQETVFYDNDFRVEGTLESLKTEVNDAFNVFASDETPTSRFLSEFSGAAAAYSVRQLGDSPVAMRVRKTVSSVDYYQVIGFDANGDLDTAAIEEFGGSADVHVQTWYDQSGNGRHQVQDTNAGQPKIYDGTDGFYYTEGNVAIFFNNQGMEDSSDNQITVLDQSIFAVAERRDDLASGRDVFVGHTDGGTYQVLAAQVWGGNTDADADEILMYAGDTLVDRSSVSVSLDTKQNLRTYGWHHESDSIFQYNGGELTPDQNSVLSPSQNTYQIGVGSNNYNSLKAYMTEVIVYEGMRDATTRTNIEKNQNEHFLVRQEASASPATGLLSEAPNATAAYSVRQLGDAKLCMKVRRGSDDATKNIGFVGGVVDTAAIEAFCGNSDGTVDTWYDQSGSDNHASQSTGSAQPKIYDNATGIVTEADKPILSFATSNKFNLSSNLSILNESFFYVTAETVDLTVYGLVDDTDYLRNQLTRYLLSDGGTLYQSSISPSSGYSVHSVINNDGAYQNGTKLADFTNALTISAESILEAHSAGSYQELVIYDSDQSDNRRTVETNINNHFKIYTPFTTGLLDSYPGATAAYSLRRLSSTYTGPAIEVTRNTIPQDIGFDTEGNLDTSALAAFCGSNDGKVSKWYDQSGNSNDLVQATANNQPKVYDGTDGLVKISDQPAVEFYESNGKFLESSSNITVDDFFVLNVIEKSIYVGSDSLWGFGTGGDTEFQRLANLNDGEDYYIRRDNGSGSNVNSYIGRHLGFEGPHNVVSLSYDQTNPVLRINGRVERDDDVSGVYGADDQRIVLGDNPQENLPYRGKQQEFLIYPSDMRTKVAGIENNINKHYSIYDQPLLDVVEDAAAAYSLRKLRAGYTGPAINVYNGTDYKDIYFRANGTLDTGAISRFCGSNDGTVAIWYDQSGGANHAEQTTPANRPKIYDGTNGLVTENEKPAVDFDGVNDVLGLSTATNLTNTTCQVIVTVYDTTSSTIKMPMGSSSTFWQHYNSNQTRIRTSSGDLTFTTGLTNGTQYLGVLNGTGTNYVIRQNAQEEISQASTSNLAISEIGRGFNNDIYKFDNKIQEIIIYESDKSSKLSSIEANINHYYSIY